MEVPFTRVEVEDTGEARASIEAEAGKYLVVGDHIWVKTAEQMYRVNTETMCLRERQMILSLGQVGDRQTQGEIRGVIAFSLDEFEEAKERAIRIAEERGDRKNVERLRKMEPMLVVSTDRPWDHPAPF